jgi:hypothetical protein
LKKFDRFDNSLALYKYLCLWILIFSLVVVGDSAISAITKISHRPLQVPSKLLSNFVSSATTSDGLHKDPVVWVVCVVILGQLQSSWILHNGQSGEMCVLGSTLCLYESSSGVFPVQSCARVRLIFRGSDVSDVFIWDAKFWLIILLGCFVDR